MSIVEQEYQRRMQSLSVKERVARSQAMFNWTREMLARQIQKEKGPMSTERLRWEVALRMYGREPVVRRLIERQLAHVSD